MKLITPENDIIGAIDADTLKKIISNLISNALKFTQSGGEIFIRLEKAEQGKDSKHVDYNIIFRRD
jgi:signal transduction histidine kinase